MTHTHSHEHDADIENLREQLAEQHRKEFFDSIKNDDDLMAERYSLIGVMSDAILRLRHIETDFIVDLVKNSEDGVCPGCLKMAITDSERMEMVALSFNHYLDAERENH